MSGRLPAAMLARNIAFGLLAGGAVGAGVGLGWYPPAVGVVAAVIVALVLGRSIRRARAWSR